jgi:hypothetical protein
VACFYFQKDPHPEIPGSALDPERLARIREVNGIPGDYHGQDQVSFWDGVYGDEGRLRHVFVKPRFQMRELERLGFSAVRVLSTERGSILEDAEIDTVQDPSIGYWCTVGE